MATEDPLVISRAWSSKFKVIKKPNSTHILNTQTKLAQVFNQIPEFFRALQNEINPRIVTRVITEKTFSQRYLLVLGQISYVLRTHLYTKEILEPDEIEPKRQIIITGYMPEVLFINHFANYLLTMMERLNKNNGHLSSSGIQARAMRESEFLMPLYSILAQRRTRFLKAGHYNNLKIRYERLLHYSFNIYKFDYENNKKPAFGEIPMWDKIIIKNGKWKKHKFLWGI